MSRRSGALQLSTPAQAGEIVFRMGKVVAGYRSDAPESIGETLMASGLLLPTAYQEMLAAQAAGQRGMALFKLFNVDGEALDNLLEDTLKRLIYGLFEWKEGTFSFVLDEQPDPWEGFALERPYVVAERGLNPQYLAIEGARLRDEHTKQDALDTYVALNEAPPDAAQTAATSEALARSLQLEETRAQARAAQAQARPVPTVAGTVPMGAPPTAQQDEDWSQVQLETVAPILPEARFVPPAQSIDLDDDKVIQFPSGGRSRRDAGKPAATALAVSQETAPMPAPVVSPPVMSPVEAPQAEIAVVEQAALEPAFVPEAEPDTPTSPWTLLVIDDDAQVLHHVREATEGRFVQVVTASSVIEALRFLQTPPQDLVVAADLIIARSDGGGILGGVEILEMVRSHWPAMPVILFSDYQNEEADARARHLGVTAQLVKPRKAQIYADGKRGGATPPMRDFLVRLTMALQPYIDATAERFVIAADPVPPAVATEIAAVEPAVAAAFTPPSAAAPTAVPTATAPMHADSTYDLRHELAAAMAASGLADLDLPPAVASIGEMGTLRSMIAEMRDPSNNDAVSLLILRFASGVFERGALFLPTRRVYVGLGGFSVNDDSERFLHRVRQVQVPVDMDSLFSQVVHFRTLIRAPLADSEGNRRLIDGLGGGWHFGDAVAVPLISGDRVAAILFGDNPSGKPLGPTDGLEIFLQQAGLMMERALLERKLEESRRKDRTSR